jgi:hypothetical protein
LDFKPFDQQASRPGELDQAKSLEAGVALQLAQYLFQLPPHNKPWPFDLGFRMYLTTPVVGDSDPELAMG